MAKLKFSETNCTLEMLLEVERLKRIGISTREIAKRMNYSEPDVAKMVIILKSNGYLRGEILFNDSQITKILVMLDFGYTRKEISEVFGISRSKLVFFLCGFKLLNKKEYKLYDDLTTLEVVDVSVLPSREHIISEPNDVPVEMIEFIYGDRTIAATKHKFRRLNPSKVLVKFLDDRGIVIK